MQVTPRTYRPASPLDLKHREAYTAPMDYRQTVLVSMLAAALTLAGVACACAVPAVDTDPAAGAHHAHHGGDHAAASMVCDHTDCGDCMADEAVSKNETLRDLAPQLPKPFLDDHVHPAAEFGAKASPLPGFAYDPPIPRIARVVDTPVRRFDKLLN